MKPIFLTVIICVIPLPLIILQLLVQPDAISFWNIIAVSFGAIAFSFLTIVLYLGTRPRFIDYSLTQKLHRVLSVLGIAAILLHNQSEEFVNNPETIQQGGDYGGSAQTIFLILASVSLLFLATKWLSYTPHLVQQFVKRFSFIRYDWVKWIHHFNLVAILLMTLHVVIINIELGIPLVGSVYVLYIVLALGSYIPFIMRKFIRPNATITSIQVLSHSFYKLTLCSTQAAAIGQTIWIRKGYQEHPFTIVEKEGNELSLIIKKVGPFTAFLSSLKLGEALYISKGNGSKLKVTEPIIYIAGGSGVTSAIALLNEWKEQPYKPFHLYWSVRTMDERNALQGYFEEIQQSYPNFHYYSFVTQENMRKRLTINDIKQNDQAQNAQFYICASSNATKQFHQLLNEFAIKNIKSESY